MNIKEEICEIIFSSLKELKIDIKLKDIIVEVPKDEKNGDLSCNIAMKLAKNLKDNPINIADKIVFLLKSNNAFKEVLVAKPGFINMYLSDDFILKYVIKIIDLKDDYGKNNIGNNKKVNIEYVSANPTGILHLGTARGAAYGDNLSNVLSFSGYDVTREYYINDGGNQIDNLGISIKERYKGLCGMEENIPEDGYHGNEIIDIAKLIYKDNNSDKLNADLDYFKNIGVEYLLNIIKKDLLSFGVSFDVWTSEKEIRRKGRIEEALKVFKEKELTYEHDNALFLRTTVYGDDKDRVLIKSDNSYTYLVPDIAYHLDKFDRGFEELIDVFGADHHSYVSRLKASIKALGYDEEKLTVKLLQMVKLLKSGTVVKMSKRLGDNVTINELVNEIGKNSARYFFASRSLDGQMDFDIDLAVKKSNENPYYYVGYAHARICSILNDPKEKNIKPDYNLKEILNEDTRNLLLKVYEFCDVIKIAAMKKEPHLIANYAYDLASMFHNFYGKHRILTEDTTITKKNLGLIKLVKITINNALKMIGVEAPETM